MDLELITTSFPSCFPNENTSKKPGPTIKEKISTKFENIK